MLPSAELEEDLQTADSESLDRCIQSALAALYPPFQATSPTVLCQVLSVVERCYRGDGLHYLLHFLLPAKQFLQTLQQDACLQYCGLLFRHEGWPLCIHEKVVVQLCHLDPRLLRPGDFYLLVSPAAAPPPPRARRSSCRGGVPLRPRLLLCGVSTTSHHVEQQEVPDVALQSLFSMAWLDSVNREREQRGASRLERCLLSAHGDVFRVPWEDLVYPQFISRPCATPKEDQESSVKDRDVLIKTSCNHSGDTASSSQDGKPLPSSPKTDQSPANSEGEDSEGEYVELTELPLPRFSPQKGSLTQSISLQHRARTSTHTLPAATAYTPQTTNTHCAASTHTSNTAHAHTDSAQACGDATCMEENHCGPAVLTPSSSSAPPEVRGAFSCQSEHTEGTDTGTSLNSEPETCTERREEEEKGEEQRKDEEKRDLVERKQETVMSVCEEEEEVQQEAKFQRDEEEDEREDTEGDGEELDEDGDDELEEGPEEVEVEEEIQVMIVQQSKERNEEEEMMKEHGKEGEREEERGCGEVHMDKDSYSESSTKQNQSEDVYFENNTQHAHTIDSYSESKVTETNFKESYSENNTQWTHWEGSYSENIKQVDSKTSYSENDTQQSHSSDSYFENSQPQTHTDSSSESNMKEADTEDSYSENTAPETHFMHSYSENIKQVDSETLCSENDTHQLQSSDSYFENSQPELHWEDCCPEITKPLHTKDSYSGSITKEADTKDSCSENAASETHSMDSYSESKSTELHCEDCYPENTKQPSHTEDSYSENTAPETHSIDFSSESSMKEADTEDSYSESIATDPHCENAKQLLHTEDSYSENTAREAQSDSYSENKTKHTHCSDLSSEHKKQETHNDDSYCESNTKGADTEDSYSEDTAPETHCEGSYSENNKQQPLTERCCFEKTATYYQDSYSENHSQSHTEDSENNIKETVSEGSYSGNTTPKADSKDSYSEKHMQHTCSEECGTGLKQPEGSFSENNTQLTHHEVSYCETSTLQIHPGDFYSEKETQPESSSSENNTIDTHLANTYSERTLLPDPADSYSESSTLQGPTEESDQSSTGQSNSEECKILQSVSSPTTHPNLLQTEPEESNGGQEIQKEEAKERSCEEVSGASEHHTEGLCSEPPPAQSQVSLTAGSSPPEQRVAAPQPNLPAPRAVPVQLTQSSQFRFYSVLLRSGAVCLPGTRDRGGRALLTVSTTSPVWSYPYCDSAELLRLLLYYTSTLRKEVLALGLTVLVDARGAAPSPALFSALRSLQEDTPGSIHAVLILTNKDSSLRVDKPAATQVEVLSSLKSVQKHVELRQLPVEFGGSFSFSQSGWISFRSRLEQLSRQCEDVIILLQKNIDSLQSTPLPPTAEDAELLLSRYKAVMCSILADSRLVQLQQEGGASLSWLRREESSVAAAVDQRAALETVSALYEQVDELLHRLVMLSNSKTQELNFIVDFRNLEQGFREVKTWLQEVGEVRLKSLEEPEDSLELLNQKQQDYKDFCTTAYEQCERGKELLSRLERWDDVSSADLHVYEDKVHSFWAQLQDFTQRVSSTGQHIERAVQLYRFLDQAYGWALQGMRHLGGISMEDCTLPDKCQAVIGCLEDYQRQHPPIPDARFQEMKVAAGELRGERGLCQWSFAWSKCQETKKMFDRKMEAALKTRDSAHRRRSDSVTSRSSVSSRKSLSGFWGIRDTSSSSSFLPEEKRNSSSPPRSTSLVLPITSTPAPSASPPTPQHTPLFRRLFRSSSSDESSDRVDFTSCSPRSRLDSSPCFTLSSSTFSISSSSSSCRRQQLRKTQSFDCPATPETSRYSPSARARSEPARRGNTGVFIRGLEGSSTEAADRTLCPRTPSHSWAGQGPHCPGTPSTPSVDSRPRGSKLRHIVEEMVNTEREYVRSLRYIIHHYFPEMDRGDLPQDLRGKRSVVFGNLEKLLDFHNQFFLKELEACSKHPLRVPHCFLRHQEQFGLYALYSKNKPKSDALLANHGHSFFRRKQLELGDKMDLSSYLLKPVQRMSKYALLLTDLMKEVGVAQEAELATLQRATNMVKFQLRHGNDLLAMDAIRDCDVNLKEQGQLIRQDEFTVWSGRRKCQRRIFLFDELVLFSKPKKMEGGLDVFIYKHSFKTADVGLTESAGNSELRFEIWFRRRTSKNQTFILQATTADIKHAWTKDIAQILWTQATRNKEMRLKEMVSMGVGNKPYLDIQPSDAAISDRAVHYIMKSRGARTRASIAVSVFDHSNPFKQGAVNSDPTASGPSSSSLLGPLNLHMYSQNIPPPPTAQSPFSASCIEEDEQEHETSSQPSMTTESSGSSSRCLSGSTGSDSGCVSSHLQETLPEEPSPPSQPPSSSSKQRLSSQYISSKSAAVISPATIV
ncbi:uncharacterized protein plekhg4 isoform X2 [Archocentrus centrarchus]|uniref:uncharacterized protein plekhg4 isoform X2 n=1 Tax=Archocentrus centrarchus TaxID=63155 RepID=UPI0011EA3DEB|nr:uncharacterized protein LOC115772449 isoform X2 [Archocentrus centrarchus]